MLLLLSLLLAVVALGCLLLVPLDLRFEASGKPDWKGHMRVEWLYGRVGRDIEPSASARPMKKTRSWPSLGQLDLLRQEPFWTRTRLLLMRCRPYVDVREIHGDLQLGLGDPADTGMAFGMIQPLAQWLTTLPRADLRVAPDFAAEGVFGEVAGGVRLLPLGLLAHGVAFVLSPEAITTYRRYRRQRSHGK